MRHWRVPEPHFTVVRRVDGRALGFAQHTTPIGAARLAVLIALEEVPALEPCETTDPLAAFDVHKGKTSEGDLVATFRYRQGSGELGPRALDGDGNWHTPGEKVDI